MPGVKSDIGMMVRFCVVTGKPADKSRFNQILRMFDNGLADRMTILMEVRPPDAVN